MSCLPAHLAPAFGVCALIMALPAAAHAYNMLHPVPASALRPMSTERPSKTDSPYTIDSGHWQIETSLYSYTRNKDCDAASCTDTRQGAAGSTTTLRLGLTQRTDIQLITDLYRDLATHDRASGARTRRSGIGDTQLRVKYNVTGNDSGNLAVAAIPYVKLPTNADGLGNNKLEWGLGVPFTYTLDTRYSLSGMTQLQLLRAPAQAGFYSAYANALVLGVDFGGSFSGYAELYTCKPDTGNRRWQNSFDLGLIYAVSDSLSIDTGTNLGLTRAADDINVFIGMAFRY